MRIDAALVRRLIAGQFPQWSDLAVEPVLPGGWDNRTFRLGPELLVRLPSHAAYAAQVDKEQRWLPRLAPQLPLAIPTPVGRGAPAEGYPWPWSVYEWIDGEPASIAPIADPVRFAADLAGFLRALEAADAQGGPAAGPHSFHRGGDLAVYDGETRRALATLEGRIDADGAAAVWNAALVAPWAGPPAWVHGDFAAGNLLVREGALAGVIDFGCCAVGDPACDLAIAWTFLAGEAREAFRRALPLDAGTWARGRAWALWKALIVMAALPGANLRDADASGCIIEAVIAEHARLTPHAA